MRHQGAWGDWMNRTLHCIIIGIYSIGIFLLIGWTAAAAATQNFPETLSPAISLIPGHIGEDYVFTGDYEDGQVTITGPGEYYLTQNLTTSSPDYAITIVSPDVILNANRMILTGPGDAGFGISITPYGSHVMVTNFSSVSGFYKGIYSEGDYAVISDSMVHDNKAIGIQTTGNFSVIERNYVFNQSDIGIFSYGHYSDILENYASFNRNGILSQGNYANISGNAGNDNSNYGIYAGGMYVGPEPGDEGHGYYPRVIDNAAILNTVGGIKIAFPHAVVYDNSVFQNRGNGIATTSRSNNTTISANYISDNPIGVDVSDQAVNLSIISNLIRSEGNSEIYVHSGSGKGRGAIYDNYMSGENHVNGTGNIGAFSWTNPAGPTPGTNIMDGPFIAGNYWTNANKTGWSDLQPANPNGYIITPYEVAPGVHDSAPLVRTSLTPTPTPTPTPVPLIVNFTAEPASGVPPLTVQFTDTSSGVPTKWNWNFGDGTSSTVKNPVHEYQGIGRYTVTLEVKNRDSTAIMRKPGFVKTIRPGR